MKTIGSIATVGPAGEAGVPCVFPFVYKNVTYSACTSVDHSGGWCATEVSKGTNEYTEWGDCPASPSSSICIKDTEDAVLLTKGRCLGGKPLARFFADLDWGCKGSATLETTQNDSCTHPCVNDVDVAHYDDGILNVGGQSTHVYFNTGEMDGVQEFNEDRFYVVGSSTPLAFTNGDGRNSNVDDPVGLGCYQSANGKVASYNIGVKGEDICVPPRSGPPLAYHVWLAASATQPATTTITKTATATPSTTSTTAPSSSASFFLVTTQPPRNEIETGIETNENLTELEQQAADDLASAPCSTLANANTRGLVAAVVIFALLTFGFMLTTIYLFRKLQTERASLRIRALTDQDATVEMMANPMLAGTQGSRQQHGPHRVRQPQHQISSSDSGDGDGDGDGDGGSNSAGIGSDAAQTASAVALQLYREPEATAELYEPPPRRTRGGDVRMFLGNKHVNLNPYTLACNAVRLHLLFLLIKQG